MNFGSTTSNSNFMVFTLLKNFALASEKSVHSKRTCLVVIAQSQPTHQGGGSPCNRNECVYGLWPIFNLVKRESYFRGKKFTFLLPKFGMIWNNLFEVFAPQELFAILKKPLFTMGLRSEKGTGWKRGVSKDASLANPSTLSFPWIPQWLGIQAKTIRFCRASTLNFSKIFKVLTFFMSKLFKDCRQERESEKMTKDFFM